MVEQRDKFALMQTTGRQTLKSLKMVCELHGGFVEGGSRVRVVEKLIYSEDLNNLRWGKDS